MINLTERHRRKCMLIGAVKIHGVVQVRHLAYLLKCSPKTVLKYADEYDCLMVNVSMGNGSGCAQLPDPEKTIEWVGD
jgi:hypothetical protein